MGQNFYFGICLLVSPMESQGGWCGKWAFPRWEVAWSPQGFRAVPFGVLGRQWLCHCLGCFLQPFGQTQPTWLLQQVRVSLCSCPAALLFLLCRSHVADLRVVALSCCSLGFWVAPPSTALRRISGLGGSSFFLSLNSDIFGEIQLPVVDPVVLPTFGEVV